jgi:cyclopropane-fatty-acyl-phospholipid synthase
MVRSNADRLASVVSRALGVDVPIRIRAWDCSEHGPPDAPTVVVHSRRALRHLVWQPGELGLARAYVSGDLDIEGDLTDALRSVWTAGAPCGYWTNAGNSDGDSDGPGGLAAAQRAKLDLVCRKLALTEGAHLVDIGCGWGSLTLHAAQHYGARVTAVTLSSEQRDFVATRAAERGVADRVDVSLTHYRDLDVTSADAVATMRWASTSAAPSTRISRRRSTHCCAPAGKRSCNRCHVATSHRVAARSSRPTSHPTCT